MLCTLEIISSICVVTAATSVTNECLCICKLYSLENKVKMHEVQIKRAMQNSHAIKKAYYRP